ncbi:MAG: class I SAM-dependent methyltransferase [Hyphomonadaceae bacterium]
MIEQQPSRTAFAAAAHRAVHQVLEKGKIFSDPMALRILDMTEADVRAHPPEASRRPMRLFIAARARFAEEKLAEGIERRGVTQLVVLGAGLDTFAYRSPLAAQLRIFEVDFPATQAWKKRRLEEAGIAAPDNLIYAPVDFEKDRLLDRLVEAGFDPQQRSFFLWLGVVPYLTREAILATLSVIGALPGGAEVAFDYSNPVDSRSLSPEALAAVEARQARVAAMGEPFLSFFEAEDLHADLEAVGLTGIDDLGPREIIGRLVAPHAAPANPAILNNIPERGGHMVHAMTAQS